jgi:hypothetical protein
MRSRTGLVLMVLLLVATAACGDDDTPDSAANGPTTTEASGPAVEITSPSDGATVKGNVVTLDLTVEDFEIVKADGDTSGKTGHFHVFIDKEPVGAGEAIDKAPGIVHTTEDPATISGLTAGEHRLVVVLGNGAHQRVGGAQDEITVTVEGPALDASAPATVAAGAPLPIEAKVEGATLVKADGDTSGKSGHLHVFVDKDPAQFKGQPIPTGDPAIIHSATSPIEVTGLTAGEHTIWVVLGNGSHVAFDPPVMDKLTVTVG